MSRRACCQLVSDPEIGAIPMVVTGTHDPYLVALSILVACVASYTAIDLGGNVRAARRLARRAWLRAAPATNGGRILSLHFLAPLPLRMPPTISPHNRFTPPSPL